MLKTIFHITITAFLGILFYSVIFVNNKHHHAIKEDNVVNVYDWYGMLPFDVINAFEKETGIRVRLDAFDNNEILEAKLLASNSGYDVVFPTASPYVSRQIRAGIYQPLNKKLLPNLKDINSIIHTKMNTIDPGLVYAIPYYWGTLGIAMDKAKVQKILPDVDLDSYEVLLNPQNLSKLKKCGVSFLEEATDVIPLVLNYLGKPSNSESLDDLKAATDHLLKLRPFIKRFSSSRFINDLVLGDTCIAQAWSGEVQKAEEEAKELGRTIIYVVPKEGTTLWIDCIAIPVGAHHPTNAHKFINFLLRPDNAAKITNYAKLPTSIETALPMVHKELRQNKAIYPKPELMAKLHLDAPQTSEKSLTYDRIRTKAWTMIRLNR